MPIECIFRATHHSGGLEMSNLPDGFVEEWTKKGQGSSIYGVPMEELTKEELFAVAVCGWHSFHEHVEDSLKTLEIIRGLREV